jgi:hypothetical protein
MGGIYMRQILSTENLESDLHPGTHTTTTFKFGVPLVPLNLPTWESALTTPGVPRNTYSKVLMRPVIGLSGARGWSPRQSERQRRGSEQGDAVAQLGATRTGVEQGHVPAF